MLQAPSNYPDSAQNMNLMTVYTNLYFIED